MNVMATAKIMAARTRFLLVPVAVDITIPYCVASLKVRTTLRSAAWDCVGTIH